jgi:hypothetical protein
MPEEWRTEIICPIYKKDNKLECKRYRGISLLIAVYKIFTTILVQRIKRSLASTSVDLGKVEAPVITCLKLDKY